MRTVLTSLTVTALCLVTFTQGLVRAQSNVAEERRAEVIRPDRQDVSRPLREIKPQRHVSTNPDHEVKRLPAQADRGRDTLAATSGSATSAATISPGMGFDGLGVGGGYTPDAAPPDTNGAVGATQYVQWVNEDFAVYDKATGNLVYGPAAGKTLWT
ncbi:MAG TPA: hypothetical protein VF507_04580, partial [Pyrinomonadaceae bacterium]